MSETKISKSHLLEFSNRLTDLSDAMIALGQDLCAYGYEQGWEMVGAGGIAGQLAKKLAEEADKP
ncbi:MAG: hypothetical protein HQL95_00545 [Magnetococcales bacterium]|nr:hypothetical protein [Magnetococcales bacterium]